jgi:hypothetical protein
MILAYEKGIEKPNSHINFVTLTTFWKSQISGIFFKEAILARLSTHDPIPGKVILGHGS